MENPLRDFGTLQENSKPRNESDGCKVLVKMRNLTKIHIINLYWGLEH